MSFTRTYVTMEVTQATFDEIRQKLEAAEYHHAIDDGLLDMHGIALCPESPKVEIKTKPVSGLELLPIEGGPAACPECKERERINYVALTDKVTCQRCGHEGTANEFRAKYMELEEANAL